MKSIILFILLALVGLLKAQNFQPWYVDSEVTFWDYNESIGGKVIKTEETNSDSSVFYLSSVLRDRNKWVCIVDSVSFLGSKVEVNKDSSWFFSKDGERLKMCHELTIGKEWSFSDSLIAIVDTIFITNILEQELEKAIISIYSNEGVSFGKIEVLKGIGIVNGFDFWDLAKNREGIKDVELLRSKRGELGGRRTSFYEMFSLPVGTVIKEVGERYGASSAPFSYLMNNELKILEKEWLNNSSLIRYEIGVVAETIKTHYDNTEIKEYRCDTIEVWRHHDDYDFEYGKILGGHTYSFSDGVWFQGSMYSENEECYAEVIDGDGSKEVYEEYGDGFYKGYTIEATPYILNDYSNYLPDSHWMDDGTWGCPLGVINGASLGLDGFEVNVIPTLVKDIITVTVNEDGRVFLYSSKGNKLFESDIKNELIIKTTPGLEGQLFYTIVSKSGKTKSGKLFVE